MVIVRRVMVVLACATLVLGGSPAPARATEAVLAAAVLAAAVPAAAAVPEAAVPAAAVREGSVLAGSAALPSLRWEWPIRPAPPVLRGFQVGPARWSPGHRGVDLGAPAGQPIRAPARGTVSFAGMVAGRPVISIDHGQGLVSSLEPVAASVHRGQLVDAGSPVGALWPSRGHCSPGTCLHWGVRENGQYIDPLRLLGRSIGPMILLPDRKVP